MTNNKVVSFAFFGTDTFSTIILDELHKAGFTPDFIVTAPDTPKGRKLVLTPPEAKVWAEEKNIPVIQPKSFDADAVRQLSAVNCQLFVVASFGKIIPQEVLNLPKHKTLNVHPSLLPKLRGASPVQTALLQEMETGVTVMRIDEKMDHGPIIDQILTHQWTLEDISDAPSLEKELAHEGGSLLAQVITPWINGEVSEQPQEHAQATYTQKLTKEDGLVSLSDKPEDLIRKIKAFKEWPKTYFFIQHKDKEKRIIITDARFKDGKLEIMTVLPEGGKEMSYTDFKKGHQS